MTRLRALPVLLLLACGGGGGAPVDANAPRADAAGTDSGAASGWTETPYLSELPTRTFAAAGMGISPGVDYGAEIVTDVGTILVDLTESQTPLAVNSFAFLARNHFFDGVGFHRVIEGFVAQGGDPNSISGPPASWGTGGPGYMFADEFVPALTFGGSGVLAMANSGPNTNGSQFFITFAPQPHLNGMHTIFGRVIDGNAVLPMIVRGQPPAVPTRIITVRIVQR